MPKRLGKLALATTLATSLYSATAISANIKSSVGKDGRVNIEVQGELVEGDTDTFIEIVKRANTAGKYVANVRLNSQGGNLLEGVKLADAIRTAKLATNVGRTSVCASACFLAFAAGAEKNASYGSQIGVHGASDQSGRETVQSGAATVSMARVARELGVPAAIIGRMVVTPPSELVWLTPQDLQSMNVTMLGKPMQTKQPDAQGPVVQQLPTAPTDLSPPGVPRANASKSASWNDIVDAATELSSRQNGGKARFFRVCQPEIKACISGISFKDKDGKSMSIKVVKDMRENVIAREICSFNSMSDVRVCTDWDRKTTIREMQNHKGDWYKVADE